MPTTAHSGLSRDAQPAWVVPEEMPVGRLVIRPAVQTDPSTPLWQAASLMHQQGVSSLLIDGGSAIVTERDITRAIGAGSQPHEAVSTVATRDPIAVDESVPVVVCGQIMLKEHVRHLVVDTAEGWRGVVSLRDVADVLTNQAQAARSKLAPQRREVRDPEPASEHWLG